MTLKEGIKFHLIAAFANLALIILFEAVFNVLVDSIDDVYFITGNDLGQFMYLTNIIFVWWLSPLLMTTVFNDKKYLKLLLSFEIILAFSYTTIVHVFFYRFPDSLFDKSWWHGYFYELKFVLPLVICLSIAIYYSQLWLGKRFLPAKYS